MSRVSLDQRQELKFQPIQKVFSDRDKIIIVIKNFCFVFYIVFWDTPVIIKLKPFTTSLAISLEFNI